MFIPHFLYTLYPAIRSERDPTFACLLTCLIITSSRLPPPVSCDPRKFGITDVFCSWFLSHVWIEMRNYSDVCILSTYSTSVVTANETKIYGHADACYSYMSTLDNGKCVQVIAAGIVIHPSCFCLQNARSVTSILSSWQHVCLRCIDLKKGSDVICAA